MQLLHIEYNKRGGIYKIFNKVNGNFYIGSSNRLRIRQKLHIHALEQQKHHSPHLQHAWNTYGCDAFEFIVMEEIEDHQNLISTEQKYLDELDPTYNVLSLAGSSLGQKRSPEAREKMRQAHLGEKHSPERKLIRILAQSGENHWTKNKKFSDDAKKKMSETHKKKYANGYVHPQLGKKKTKEQIEKMHKLNTIPVDQLTLDGIFIKTWESAAAVQRELGIFASGIGACCKGRAKTVKKFKWRYSNYEQK
jgi:group I intron endonuclease